MMIDKINNENIADFIEKTTNQQPNKVTAPENSRKGDSIQVNYADLIDKAIQISKTDSEAIQNAKQLIASGELDSPEHIQATAENIIDFGI